MSQEIIENHPLVDNLGTSIVININRNETFHYEPSL